MTNAYQPSHQNEAIDAKIMIALEKISESFKVLLWRESKNCNLSPIQIQILIFLHNHPREQSMVSYLAIEFNMSKATISDSVKSLEQKGLITKNFNQEDSRSHQIILTKEGKKIANKLPQFSLPLQNSIIQLPAETKKQLFEQLLSLIQNLQESNIISLQRMCFHCIYYKLVNEEHYCNFLKKALKISEIRLDCPEHVSNILQA